jgi:hypothetical protein
MKKIFISGGVLDSLFAENKAELDGDRLTIHTRNDQVYRITAAFKFISVADGSKDTNGLMGKIYTKEELDKIKADIYMDSAIVNDLAYTVEPGFVGVPEAGPEPAAAAKPAKEQPRSPSEQASADESAEQDQLADYLLKIL